MLINRCKTYLARSLILMVLVLTGCKELGEGLGKVVVIEYDQSLNFQEYQLEQTLGVPGAGEWEKIKINDESENVPKKGVWILYQVCSVQNNAPQAEPFNYDVSKFYVEYGGKNYYYKNLVPYTYQNQQLIPATPSANNVVAPQFHNETQTSPNQQGIPPNSNNTLSVSWRFVVYVSTNLGDQTDLLKLNLPLFYDGQPVNMVDRGYETIPKSGIVHKSDLPTSCRPKK